MIDYPPLWKRAAAAAIDFLALQATVGIATSALPWRLPWEGAIALLAAGALATYGYWVVSQGVSSSCSPRTCTTACCTTSSPGRSTMRNSRTPYSG